MCLAIAPNSQRSNSLVARSWRHIASTPLKLLSFAAVVHLLIGTAIIIYGSETGTDIDLKPLLSGFTYGVVPLVVFGFLLTWLPRKHSLSPAHHGRYNSVYLFMMTALFLLEFASISGISRSGESWALAGMLLLTPGWIIALQGLWDMHGWIRSKLQIFSQLLLTLLLINLVLLIITALVIDVTTLIPVLITWPLIFFFSAVLIEKAPAKSRIICF